jgi:hypothetical protein
METLLASYDGSRSGCRMRMLASSVASVRIAGLTSRKRTNL